MTAATKQTTPPAGDPPAPGVPPAPQPSSDAPTPISPWRMGLVVTASALCGGIAVVLWNRRLLTRMREVAPVARPESQDLQGRLWEDDM